MITCVSYIFLRKSLLSLLIENSTLNVCLFNQTWKTTEQIENRQIPKEFHKSF